MGGHFSVARKPGGYLCTFTIPNAETSRHASASANPFFSLMEEITPTFQVRELVCKSASEVASAFLYWCEGRRVSLKSYLKEPSPGKEEGGDNA